MIKKRVLCRTILLTLVVYFFSANKNDIEKQLSPSIRKLLQSSNSTSNTSVDDVLLAVKNCTPEDPLWNEINSGMPRVPDAFTPEELRAGWVIFYPFGVMYMFLALSIVCDEYFVPALEEATEAFQISNDVAGATLMAAGGSAPELATSFIGTFYESDVGFGTIVGSAVFNVLFVIGMCVIFSKDVLALTWWPLLRDCTYYALSLGVLACFFGVISPNEIETWEAGILLCMYFGYVILMKYNLQIMDYIVSFFQTDPSSAGNGKGCCGLSQKEMLTIPDDQQMVFRAGLLHLFYSGDSILQTANIYIVKEIQGDVNATFKEIDKDNSGSIDSDELTNLLNKLGSPTEADIKTAFGEMDINHDGQITLAEFKDWYIRSEQRIKYELDDLFDKFDTDNDGKIKQGSLLDLLKSLQSSYDVDGISKETVEQCVRDLDANKDGFIDKKEFGDWYTKQEMFKQKKETNMKEADAFAGPALTLPDSCGSKIMFFMTLPLVLPMYLTCPNVRIHKWKSWWPLTFLNAIIWIAVFSYFMVQWATILGLTIAIPPKVMGLIFLAAGTSIPDLLTSVAVAMQGKGDMAVSSSIGSNIFDVLMGLPFPWVIKSLLEGGKSITVGSPEDNVGLSVGILFLMVLLIIVTIASVGWKLNKPLAGVFFFFYILYVSQELVRYYLYGPGSHNLPCA